MLEKNSQNQIRSFSLNTNASWCSSLRVKANFSFKFDLYRSNSQIEILNFCRLVKIVVKKLVTKSLKLAFGRSNLEPKTLYLLKNLERFSN